jgi:imidazolonepropionase
MRGTVHADELEGSGGAELAAELGADSADHLGRISDAGIDALADSDTVGVLLPGTIFSLGLNEQAPARRMIDAGVALALATDFNPGSNWCESMPLTLAIACTRLHLHPHEALTMATINAAHALRRADHVGSLAVGKSMDVNILRGDSVDSLAHHLGLDPLQKVVRDGRVVVDHGAPIGV